MAIWPAPATLTRSPAKAGVDSRIRARRVRAIVFIRHLLGIGNPFPMRVAWKPASIDWSREEANRYNVLSFFDSCRSLPGGARHEQVWQGGESRPRQERGGGAGLESYRIGSGPGAHQGAAPG